VWQEELSQRHEDHKEIFNCPTRRTLRLCEEWFLAATERKGLKKENREIRFVFFVLFRGKPFQKYPFISK